MTPTVASHETFQSLFVTCALKGTMLLLLVGVLALLSPSASRRHFIWVGGFLCLGALLALEPWVPQWGVLPDWQNLVWLENIRPWLLPIWALGALLFCGKVILGILALFRIERNSTVLSRDPWDGMLAECRRDLGINRPVHLLKFPGRIMPMTWGVLRNFVVLPSSAVRWSGQRVRAVLMHELAHIRRGDYIASLMRDAICAFYWFHPLVWWAAREMDDDREEASDDAVIAAGQRPVSYAEHLTTVATRGWGRRLIDPQVRPRVALAEKPLIVRIRSILTPWKSRHAITWPQRIQTGAVLGLLLVVTLMVGPRKPVALVSNDIVTDGVVQTTVQFPGAAFQPIPMPAKGGKLPLAESSVEAVQGWRSSEMRAVDLEGAFLTLAPSPNDQSSNEPSGASQSRPVNSGVVLSETGVLGNDLLASEAAQRQRESGRVILPPAEYSTSPPEESDEGLDAIDISEFMESFENVGHVGMADFDLGQLGDDGEALADGGFDLGDFASDGGLFSTASVGAATKTPIEKVKPDTESRDSGKVTEPQRQGTSVEKRLESVKLDSPNEGLKAAGQSRRDNALHTRVGMVKSKLNGTTHIAINFRRDSGAPTAKFRFEASPDLKDGSWDFDPDLFVFASMRTVNDVRESTIVLRQPLNETPYRFLRIRSTSALGDADGFED